MTGSNRSDFVVSLALTGLLMAAVVLIYIQVIQSGFVCYDDPSYVLLNPHVLTGVGYENLAWAFGSFEAGNWHPMTWLSLQLDSQFFGNGPVGYHVTNLVLHVLNTAGLFWLLRRMTSAMWPSAVVAAFFGLHPLHVESVAWVAERKDVLSAFFGLAATWAYVEYAQADGDLKARRKYYCLAVVLLGMGLMAKPMLVTLPFVWFLLDFWPLGRLGGAVVKCGAGSVRGSLMDRKTLVWRCVEKVPFFLLAVVASILTCVAQQKGGAMSSLEDIPFGARVSNALVCYVIYLWKMVYPAKLAIVYPYRTWPVEGVVGAVVVLAALSVLAFKQWRKRPWIAMGWLWYLGMLVPVIGLVQVGQQSMADRYVYLPMAGVLIAVVWTVAQWRIPTFALKTGGLLLLLFLANLSARQVKCWKDSGTLFVQALRVTENNYVAHNFLGIALGAGGDTAGAIAEFSESVRIYPRFADSRNNLGFALETVGRHVEAAEQYHQALLLKPEHLQARNNLALLLAQRGQFAEAATEFAEVVRLQPGDAMAYSALPRLL